MSAQVTFQPISQDDLEFLYHLYASTREQELSRVAWDEAQKARFLHMQFHAQHQYYQQQFADARFDLILLGGLPIGRLYVHRRPEEIRVIDIALLPEHRGRGIGGAIMRDLLAEATRMRKPLRLHVEGDNPALHLYHRLGFTRIGEHGVYHLMEWSP